MIFSIKIIVWKLSLFSIYVWNIWKIDENYWIRTTTNSTKKFTNVNEILKKNSNEKICDEKKQKKKTKRSTMNIVVIKRFLTKFFKIVVDERIDKSIKFKLIIFVTNMFENLDWDFILLAKILIELTRSEFDVHNLFLTFDFLYIFVF